MLWKSFIAMASTNSAYKQLRRDMLVVYLRDLPAAGYTTIGVNGVCSETKPEVQQQ